ncbi:MAG: hypothetical protein P1P88_07965 [Bacteroidales bacterium]|nr:hypothetical protein [Bacteroidales bacterium]
MKNRFSLIGFIIVIICSFGCNQNFEKKTANNLLLAKVVTSSCVANIANTDTPEWTKGFDRINFFKQFFSIALSGKVKVYGYAALGDTINRKIFLATELSAKIRQHVDTIDFELFKEIRFIENWTFHENNTKFEKEVIAWTPIKIWKKDGEVKKQMVSFAYPKNPAKGRLVAHNIFYEHPWYQEYPNIYTGFDQLNFMKLIIDKIKSGEIIAYDPIYLVDGSKRKFRPTELETYIGENLESFGLENAVNTILFEEDWYFDQSSLGLTKDVKSIAFVGYGPYDEATDSHAKKILFFIFPK